MKMDEPSPQPPQNLAPELHGAFAQLCGRLQASGAEVTELDAIVVARVAQAEASLERARAEAEKSPLVVGSPANGQCAHPAQKLLQNAEANLRAWLRLLPKTSGGGHPVHTPPPHVSTAGDVAPVAGGDVVADGEPPERVRLLRAMLKEFRAAGGGAGTDGAAMCSEGAG